MIGTAYTVTFATVLSTPIGILTALYIVEVKGRFAGLVRFFVQAMSGVPSIVAGLFILSILVIPVTQELTGLMGSLALSLFGIFRIIWATMWAFRPWASRKTAICSWRTAPKAPIF